MDDMEALRIIFRWAPWKRDKISRAVARYLDGVDPHALDGAPTIKAQIDAAFDHIDAIAAAQPQGETS